METQALETRFLKWVAETHADPAVRHLAAQQLDKLVPPADTGKGVGGFGDRVIISVTRSTSTAEAKP